MAAIPQLLTDFRVYLGPQSMVELGVATVALPSFERMTETISGAGIAGEVAVPIKGHFTSQKIMLNFRAPTLKQLVMLNEGNHIFDIRGSIQVQDPASQIVVDQEVKIDCRGPVNKIELGNMEAGKQFGSQLEMELYSFVMSLDGKRIVELDKFNQVFKVNGVDQYAAIRRNLGGV